MKLFKNNKVISSQTDDSDKKIKSKGSMKKADKGAKSYSLDSWILQPLTVAVVCFGLCYLLLELYFLKPLDAGYQSQVVATQAQALEIEVSRYFDDQVRWLDSLSAAEIVEEQSIIQILKKTKVVLCDLHIFSAEKINVNGVKESLSFASNDLLRLVSN